VDRPEKSTLEQYANLIGVEIVLAPKGDLF